MRQSCLALTRSPTRSSAWRDPRASLAPLILWIRGAFLLGDRQHRDANSDARADAKLPGLEGQVVQCVHGCEAKRTNGRCWAARKWR